MPHRDIEQMPRRNARRIVVVILRPRRRYLDKGRTILRWSAGGKRRRERRTLASTEQSSLQLLIPGKPGQVYWSCRISCERNCTGHQSAVVPPIDANPRPTLPRLVLQVGGLVELLVVVNSENA